MQLRILNETTSSVTVGWDPVPGAVGFDFYVDGKRVSFTHDGTRTSVKFGKLDANPHVYGVWALTHSNIAEITVPVSTQPPPPPSTIGQFKGACAYAPTGTNGLQNAQATAGITRVRCDFTTATSDAMFAEARRLGMKILAIADYALGMSTRGDHYPPDDFQAWSNKVAGRVAQGLDVIEAVQVWNEPFNTFWMPKPSPAEYLRLVKTVAPAVWAISPNMPIVVCLDYWQGGTGSGQWAQQLLAADTTKFLTDPRIRFSAHCYCQDAPPEKDRGTGWSFDRYKIAHQQAVAHGHPNGLIWVTEYGWDTPGGSETYPVSEALQADYTERAIRMMQQSGIVERAFLYQWKADAWYGILRPDANPRPVCARVKAMA